MIERGQSDEQEISDFVSAERVAIVSGHRIGVDVGGTKISAILLGDDGRPWARRRIASPRGDYAATLAAVVDLVSQLESETGVSASVGVGVPGAISPATGLIKNANSTWLIGKAFDRDLEAAVGRPVRVANDANCFALSEAVDGAGTGAATVFGVILGTGVGGGLVVNGRVLDGANAIAGEWGHNPLPWPRDDERPGARCYCGRDGCIETVLSGSGLTRDYGAITGDLADAETISHRARAGDRAARGVLGRYQDRLARALASVANLLDPEVIVLGGGVSNLPGLCEAVMELWGAVHLLRPSSDPCRHGRARR